MILFDLTEWIRRRYVLEIIRELIDTEDSLARGAVNGIAKSDMNLHPIFGGGSYDGL